MMLHSVMIGALIVHSALGLYSLSVLVTSFTARARKASWLRRLCYASAFAAAVIFLTATWPLYRNSHEAVNLPLYFSGFTLLICFSTLKAITDEVRLTWFPFPGT